MKKIIKTILAGLLIFTCTTSAYSETITDRDKKIINRIYQQISELGNKYPHMKSFDEKSQINEYNNYSIRYENNAHPITQRNKTEIKNEIKKERIKYDLSEYDGIVLVITFYKGVWRWATAPAPYMISGTDLKITFSIETLNKDLELQIINILKENGMILIKDS